MHKYTVSKVGHGSRPVAVVERADSAVSRTIGLLGKRSLAVGTGLWLVPCKGVHTFGMRFSIDVIVLDSGLRVNAVCANVAPNKMVAASLRGSSVLELAAGTAAEAGLQQGDQLRIVVGA